MMFTEKQTLGLVRSLDQAERKLAGELSHREDWEELKDAREVLRIIQEGDPFTALDILADLIDAEEDCRYDHHGFCQMHGLRERPCAHERAKKLLLKYGEL
jgi:hypothetical protein